MAQNSSFQNKNSYKTLSKFACKWLRQGIIKLGSAVFLCLLATTLFAGVEVRGQNNTQAFNFVDVPVVSGPDIVNEKNQTDFGRFQNQVNYASLTTGTAASGKKLCIFNRSDGADCVVPSASTQCDYDKKVCRILNNSVFTGGFKSVVPPANVEATYGYLTNCTQNSAGLGECKGIAKGFERGTTTTEPKNLEELDNPQGVTGKLKSQALTGPGQEDLTGELRDLKDFPENSTGKSIIGNAENNGNFGDVARDFVATGINAVGDAVNKVTKAGADLLGGFFKAILGVVVDLFRAVFWILGGAMSFVVSFLGWVFVFFVRLNPASSQLVTALEGPWRALVQVANIFVLSGFLFVGFGYLLDIKSLKQDIRQFLTGVVIFGVLLQFTLYGSAAVVNIFQGIGDTLIAVVNSGGNNDKGYNEALIGRFISGISNVSDIRCKESGRCTNSELELATGGSFSELFGGELGDKVSILVGEIIFFITLVFAAIIFFKAAYLALGRLIVLWFLMLLSPIALGSAFTPIPTISAFASKWADKFIKLAIFYPAIVIALLTGNYFAGELAKVLLDPEFLKQTLGAGIDGVFLDLVSRVAIAGAAIGTLAYIVKFFREEFDKFVDAAVSGVSNGAKSLVGAGSAVVGGVKNTYGAYKGVRQGASLLKRSVQIGALGFTDKKGVESAVDQANKDKEVSRSKAKRTTTLRKEIEDLEEKKRTVGLTAPEAALLATKKSEFSTVNSERITARDNYNASRDVAAQKQADYTKKVDDIRNRRLPLVGFETKVDAFFKTLPLFGTNQKSYAAAIAKADELRTRAELVINAKKDGTFTEKYSTLEGFRDQDLPELQKLGINNYKEFQDKYNEYKLKNPGASESAFIKNTVDQLREASLIKNLEIDPKNLPVAATIAQLKEIQKLNNFQDGTLQQKAFLINTLKDTKMQGIIANNQELRPLVDKIKTWFNTFDTETQNFIQEKLPGFLPEAMQSTKLAIIEAILQGGEDSIEATNFGANLAASPELRDLLVALGGSNKKVMDAVNAYDRTTSAFNDKYALAGVSQEVLSERIDDLLASPTMMKPVMVNGAMDVNATRQKAQNIVINNYGLIKRLATDDSDIQYQVIDAVAKELTNEDDTILGEPERKEIIDKEYSKIFFGTESEQIVASNKGENGTQPYIFASSNVQSYFNKLESDTPGDLKSQLNKIATTTFGNQIVNSPEYQKLENDEQKMMYAKTTYNELVKNISSNRTATDGLAQSQGQKLKIYQTETAKELATLQAGQVGNKYFTDNIKELQKNATTNPNLDVKTELTNLANTAEGQVAIGRIGATGFRESIAKSIASNPNEVKIGDNTYNFNDDSDVAGGITRKLTATEKSDFAMALSNLGILAAEAKEATNKGDTDKVTAIEARISAITDELKEKGSGTVVTKVLAENSPAAVLELLQKKGLENIKNVDNVLALAERGGLTSQQRVDKGLADTLGYFKEADKTIKESTKTIKKDVADRVLAPTFEQGILKPAQESANSVVSYIQVNVPPPSVSGTNTTPPASNNPAPGAPGSATGTPPPGQGGTPTRRNPATPTNPVRTAQPTTIFNTSGNYQRSRTIPPLGGNPPGQSTP